MSSNWQSALEAQGALWDANGLRTFERASAEPVSDTQLFALDHLGCLVVEGPEARKFLQGQVTCDTSLITLNHAQRGAHCNTKGRMLFNFTALQVPASEDGADSIALIMPRGLLERAQTALGKYIVFSKADIARRDDLKLIGLSGTGAAALAADLLPILPIAPGDVGQGQNGFGLRVAGERFLCLIPEADALEYWTNWSARAALHGYQGWHLADIRDGVGQVLPGTEEMFIPQMLNMHLTGGVSFKKGCYIGQEVVARMQYLGKLKRHMRRLQLATGELPEPGAALYSTESSQSVGNVVMAAPAGDGLVEMLAVTTDAAFEGDALYRDAECSQQLQALALPYVITK
ncbi:CAF17-like 4Fe-4S cluster assembly/insertion protein YgfZ [Gilvimarinus sp. F26214L]|uniref:CAF17-like 4Fe-4S cluster assembly/insertion protein YgfZ n=1 Tax=Gilvimarinus sp. DZF01 TaxID=3461371 RepID=UPI00404609CB